MHDLEAACPTTLADGPCPLQTTLSDLTQDRLEVALEVRQAVPHSGSGALDRITHSSIHAQPSQEEQNREIAVQESALIAGPAHTPPPARTRTRTHTHKPSPATRSTIATRRAGGVGISAPFLPFRSSDGGRRGAALESDNSAVREAAIQLAAGDDMKVREELITKAQVRATNPQAMLSLSLCSPCSLCMPCADWACRSSGADAT